MLAGEQEPVEPELDTPVDRQRLIRPDVRAHEVHRRSRDPEHPGRLVVLAPLVAAAENQPRANQRKRRDQLSE